MEALISNPCAIEPLLPQESNRSLEDVAFELTIKASSLAGQVNPVVALTIGSLVRSLNCYYSNLIEGHDTHPRGYRPRSPSELFRAAEKTSSPA